MPQLWIQQEDQEQPWAVVPLAGGVRVFYLTGNPDLPVVTSAHTGASCPAYIMRHGAGDGHDRWMLFASSEAQAVVNGMNLEIAMRALRDQDEIHIGRTVMFFSTERLPRITPMPRTDKPCTCPRCQAEIEPGTPAVQCPTCGLWHHQSEQSPCWSYGEKCAAFCDQPTALEGSFRWAPECL